MRIWLDIGICGANPTGIPRATANLAFALKDVAGSYGLDVLWISFGLDGRPRVLRSMPAAIATTGVAGRLLHLGRSLPVSPGLRRLAATLVHRWGSRTCDAEAAPEITTIAPDVLLLPHAGSAALPRRAIEELRAKGTVIAAICHDILPLTRPDLFSAADVASFRDALTWLARRADMLIAVSGATARDLESWRPTFPDAAPRIAIAGNVIILPPPANTLWRRLGLSEHQRVFALIGAFVPRKNHLLALAAMDQLWAAGNDTILLCVGPPHPLGRVCLARLHRHREHGRRLRIVHDASDAEIAEVYAKATAVLMPSEAEGYGMPIAEAALAGCPVVCSDLPVFREIAGEGTVFLPVGDVSVWTDALSAMARGAPRRPVPAPTYRYRERPIARLIDVLQQAIVLPGRSEASSFRAGMDSADGVAVL